jgi:rod shape-determining protein MreD
MKGLAALIFIVVLTLLLRSTALTALAARGIVVDVLAFATVVWALRCGETWGSTFGFALGLAADLDAAHWLGRHALLLALIGYGVGRMSRSMVRDSARTQAVLLLAATVVHQAWVVMFELGGLAGWSYLVRRVVLATLATVPVGTLIVAVVRRVSGQSLFGHAATQADPAN